MRDAWYESDNPDRVARGLGIRAGGWIVAGVAFFILLGAGVWGFRVATSDIRGQGDATVQKNSGTNRIAAQERFEERYQDILAADRRIDVMAAAAKASKGETAQVNLTGAINYCIEAVAEYNADARKFTAREFRAADLPPRIDNLDPATDCKETVR